MNLTETAVLRQLCLFDPVAARQANRRLRRGLIADLPRARTADPETSHEAAEEVRASGRLSRQQWWVLAALHRWPGLTASELAARMAVKRGCHWAELVRVVNRRLPELAVARRVVKGETRKCSVTKRRAAPWWPVNSGVSAA